MKYQCVVFSMVNKKELNIKAEMIFSKEICIYVFFKKYVGDFKYFLKADLGLKKMKRIGMSKI